jgi:hypothetical protein
MKSTILFLALDVLAAQTVPVVSKRTQTDQVQVVRVAPRFATAIRVPEPVSSLVLGDPEKFLAEHSDKEPTLVLVKPTSELPGESNLLVLTTSGRQYSFLLRADSSGGKQVDFVLAYKPRGSFLVEESVLARSEVAGISALQRVQPEAVPDTLTARLKRQQLAPLPPLYGAKPPTQTEKGDRIRAGVSEVIDEGRTVMVMFSAVNPQSGAIEIMPPQVQLAGKSRKGALIRKDQWTTSEQLPVLDFRLSRRRLGSGERVDGVVVFTRPGFKQAHESLFLQLAESGAVDQPALAPIGFGVSAIREEVRHD